MKHSLLKKHSRKLPYLTSLIKYKHGKISHVKVYDQDMITFMIYQFIIHLAGSYFLSPVTLEKVHQNLMHNYWQSIRGIQSISMCFKFFGTWCGKILAFRKKTHDNACIRFFFKIVYPNFTNLHYKCLIFRNSCFLGMLHYYMDLNIFVLFYST